MLSSAEDGWGIAYGFKIPGWDKGVLCSVSFLFCPDSGFAAELSNITPRQIKFLDEQPTQVQVLPGSS